MDINNSFKLVTDKLTTWFEDFIKLIPNIAVAALILVLGFYLAKLIRNLFRKVVSRIITNKTLENLVNSLIYIFLLGIVIFIALSVLKLDRAVTSMLAGIGVLGLALAFAFQDIAANFMSGIFLSLRKPIVIGDVVKIQNYMGKIEAINLRDTVIRTYQGQMVIIPNKTVFQSPIENYSLLGKRRMDLELGISYGDDLDKVKEIALAAVKDIEGLSSEDEITMFYTEFGDSSINFVIRLWVCTTAQINFMEVKSQSIIRIKKAFDENDIMIPFPIRTLDFGIKGGVPLNDILKTKGVGSEN